MAKIEKSAKEFESMLLSTWLQQAEQSMATVPGAEDDEDAAGRDQMMSLGVQSLATAMAASGGIGIASMIAKALHCGSRKGSRSTARAAAHGETGKDSLKNKLRF
jgi:Rod binding domain-containing protein